MKLTSALLAAIAFASSAYATSVFDVDPSGNATVTTLTTTATTGTAPLVVNSATKVVNLNADALQGQNWTAPTIATPTITGAITFPAGVRQTFMPDATNAGLNVGTIASNPASPVNGDLWYNSASGSLNARIAGSDISLGAGGTPAGSNTQVQYNASGSFGANSGFTTDTSGNVTTRTLTSTVASGTAPFAVTSTTNIANLNASSLNGATFAAPGAIGGTTAGSGAFTTLSATTSEDFSNLTASSLIATDGSKNLTNPTVGSTLSFASNSLGINLGNANTWTGAQTMGQGILQATLDYVQVANSSGQSCPDNAETTVTWDTNVFISNSSMHSTSSNTSRLVAPTAGIYELIWNRSYAFGTNPGTPLLRIEKNGSTVVGFAWVAIGSNGSGGNGPTAGQRAYGNAIFYLKMAASDYIEVQFGTQGGSDSNVIDSTSLPSNSATWIKISN